MTLVSRFAKWVNSVVQFIWRKNTRSLGLGRNMEEEDMSHPQTFKNHLPRLPRSVVNNKYEASNPKFMNLLQPHARWGMGRRDQIGIVLF